MHPLHSERFSLHFLSWLLACFLPLPPPLSFSLSLPTSLPSFSLYSVDVDILFRLDMTYEVDWELKTNPFLQGGRVREVKSSCLLARFGGGGRQEGEGRRVRVDIIPNDVSHEPSYA